MSDERDPDREARVAQLLNQAARSERAPASLRAAVEAQREQASEGGRGSARRGGARTGRVRPGSAWPGAGLAMRYGSLATAAIAAVVIALVLTLGGAATGPSVAQAAALAVRGPAAPAPLPDPAAPASLLNVRVGDLQFPNWEHDGGWRSNGQRRDRLGSRTVTTVYYWNAGRQLAYSIVSLPRLSGRHARGEPYATFRQHGRTVIVWTERNHTCVLSAAGMTAPSLWHLAVSVSAKQA